MVKLGSEISRCGLRSDVREYRLPWESHTHHRRREMRGEIKGGCELKGGRNSRKCGGDQQLCSVAALNP